MKFGLIGHPIEHSLSPTLFKAAYDGKYQYDLIQTSDFEEAYRRFLEEYDGIEWGQLIGLRNVTAHNYENIVDDVIWEIIHDDVPEIKEYLEKILYN